MTSSKGSYGLWPIPYIHDRGASGRRGTQQGAVGMVGGMHTELSKQRKSCHQQLQTSVDMPFKCSTLDLHPPAQSSGTP